MVVDEQEFRTFLANIKQVMENCGVYREQTIKALNEGKIQLNKYIQQIDNQPIKSKWKQLQLPINP